MVLSSIYSIFEYLQLGRVNRMQILCQFPLTVSGFQEHHVAKDSGSMFRFCNKDCHGWVVMFALNTRVGSTGTWAWYLLFLFFLFQVLNPVIGQMWMTHRLSSPIVYNLFIEDYDGHGELVSEFHSFLLSGWELKLDALLPSRHIPQPPLKLGMAM